jgi:protein ImuB
VFPEPCDLSHEPDLVSALAIFERWGLRTMGDVARLPRADLLTRLGPIGVRLHQAARGEDLTPLVPTDEIPRFCERLELEWPIEGLEPLSFVLGRLCDALSLRLERADRGAVVITTRLGLVTHTMHVRTLQIPSPMRDPRVLRTLIVLDLESHPPPAAIDVVEVDVDVTPGRIVQGSLLTRPLPTAENLATLLARLGALMGESRVGAPALVNTHDDRAMTQVPFAIASGSGRAGRGAGNTAHGSGLRAQGERRTPTEAAPHLVVRRLRFPLAARVEVDHGAPVRVAPAAHEWPGGQVVASAGPWRSSGQWWALDGARWDRDEWDVEITGGLVYRLARDRATGQWAIDAVVD